MGFFGRPVPPQCTYKIHLVLNLASGKKGKTENFFKEICSQELSLQISANATLTDFDGLECLTGKQAKAAYLNSQQS